MTDGSPNDGDHWRRSLTLLREIPAYAASADLLEHAEERWRGKVLPQTSMADLFFTHPHERFPWGTKVWARQLGDEFEFELARDGDLISSARTTTNGARETLDAFLTQLIAAGST